MNPSRRELNRFIALGSAVAVISVPVALVATTWQPLEPAARGGGEEEPNEADGALSEEPRNRDKKGRKDKVGVDENTPQAR